MNDWPSHWKVATLDEITTKITSGSRDWKPYYGRGKGVFILTQNVRMRELDLSNPFHVDPPVADPARARSAVQEDDLLINIVGAVGSVARVRERIDDHYVCQSVALARPQNSRLSPWLELYLSAPTGGQRYFANATYGLGRPHLSFADIKATPILIPPFEEQDRIVEIVEELLTQIAEGERQLQSAIDAADRCRAAALRDALNGSWPTVNLGSALVDLRYGTSRKSTYDGAGIPVLRIPNISGGVVSTDDLKFAELTDSEIDLLELRADDILIIRSNGSVGLVGRGARVISDGQGMAYAGYLIRLRTDPNLLRPEFLELVLAAPQLRIQVEGHARSTSGVHNINSDEVRGLSLPLPPPEDQDEIIRRCRIQLAAIADLEQTVGSQQVEARRLRQAVLRDAICGTLTSEVYA